MIMSYIAIENLYKLGGIPLRLSVLIYQIEAIMPDGFGVA